MFRYNSYGRAACSVRTYQGPTKVFLVQDLSTGSFCSVVESCDCTNIDDSSDEMLPPLISFVSVYSFLFACQVTICWLGRMIERR